MYRVAALVGVQIYTTLYSRSQRQPCRSSLTRLTSRVYTVSLMSALLVVDSPFGPGPTVVLGGRRLLVAPRHSEIDLATCVL